MRKFRLTIILSLFLIVFAVLPVNAEETTVAPTYVHQEKLIQNRPEWKVNLQEKKQSSREAMQTKKTEINEERLDLLESIKEKREAVKTEFKQKREEFMKRLQTLRDENKKTVVERVDTRLSTINTNRTEQMTEVLQKLDALLVKLSAKVSELKTSGVDVSGAEAAVAAATTALESAKNTVSTQAAKEYIAQISTETALKQEVWTAVNQLKTDLKSTHKNLVDAHKAVRNAATEIAKLKHKTQSAGDTISQ